MRENKQNIFIYRLVQLLSWFAAKLIFRCRLRRNELKGKKGPCVVIANHEASLDFVNLISANRRPMTFVISRSFYDSSSVQWGMRRIGAIPKQQFQTTLKDMRRMKSVIDAGEILVIYPAGLMCEDGRSTPVPTATYQFLKWLRTDVYVARSTGSYFVSPKWTRGFRPGRTYLDIYCLFTAEELVAADVDTVRSRTDAALTFDAYREQEAAMSRYQNGDCIEGLEHVLYLCPHCHREYTLQVTDRSRIECTACGYAERSDSYGFLHLEGEVGEEIRYVSDWSRMIYERERARVLRGEGNALSAETQFQMIDEKKRKFATVGEGQITLTPTTFRVQGQIRGELVDLSVPICDFASLPFRPGKYLEIQQGENIYRCVLKDGRLAMKLINLVKIYYELSTADRVREA